MTQSIYIAGDIQYVTGTINGTSYTWTLTGDHVWTATGVATSQNGEYLIELLAVDTSGNELNLSTVTYYGLHLITDRGPGTYYNATDLNRVGAAVQYIANRLGENGCAVDVNPQTGWTTLAIPSVTQMQSYLQDVYTIKEALYSEQEIPQTMNKLTYIGANNIEKALKQTEEYIILMINAMTNRCGIFHTGGHYI